MTQEDLAHAAGLARTYVGSVETGDRNISLHAVWRLAHALDVSPRSFFPSVEAAESTPTQRRAGAARPGGRTDTRTK